MTLNLFRKRLELPAPTCSHNWNLFAKTYAAPRPGTTDVPDDILEKIILGVTTYSWECLSCGELKKMEVLGSDDSQLADVLEKAKTLGIQYVTYDNARFGIALVPKGEGKIPLQ